MSQGKLNRSRMAVFIVLAALFVIVVENKEDAEQIFRHILESNWPTYIIWFFALFGVIATTIYSNRPNENGPGNIYAIFRKYGDAVFTIATYGFSGSTSLALLKGLYLQAFFDQSFFSGFGRFDLASIFIISSFLLYFSLTETVRHNVNFLWQIEGVKAAGAKSNSE